MNPRLTAIYRACRQILCMETKMKVDILFKRGNIEVGKMRCILSVGFEEPFQQIVIPIEQAIEKATGYRVHINAVESEDDPPQSVSEPVWIVNDMGELGVAVNGRYYFCYKGGNIEYQDGIHDDGTPIKYRIIGKREFGETVWPLSWIRAGRSLARYTQPLVYHPGLSDGEPEDGDWRDLPQLKSRDNA